MLDINLQSEYIASFFGLRLTNTFITSIFVIFFLTISAIIFYFKKNNHKNIIINGIRIMIYELLKFIDKITNDRKTSKKILPLVATFFFFIATSNLLALIPGFLGSFYVFTPLGKAPIFRSPNSDITTTLALALFSVLSIQFFSITTLGVVNYLKRFFNFTNPIKFIMGFFELISEGVKIISFSFRLFGNIFAGEVLLLVIAFLIPYIIPLPFMILELFVGIIQAFIFAVLTLTFIKVGSMRNV